MTLLTHPSVDVIDEVLPAKKPVPSCRMKIAWICPFLPKPEYGGAVRCYHLIRRASEFHQVDLLVIQDGEGIPADLLPKVHSVRFFSADRGRRVSKLLSAVTSFSQQRLETSSCELDAWLAQHSEDYDAVVCEFTRTAWAKIANGPVRVLDLHNIEHELLLRNSAIDGNPWRRVYRHLDGLKLRREEMEACGRFDLIATCSDRERDLVSQWEGAPKVMTAPNGVDIARFARSSEAGIQATADLLFLGTMNYFPNEQAVRHFHKEILPLILAERPGTTVRIVGVNPPASLKALDAPNFRIVGGVPDVRPEYWGAKVLIVPLLSGSGTRLKILEGAGAGTPIVTTSLGCEGITFRAGIHGLIADTPRAFADACLHLLDDQVERARLAEAGRRMAVAHYDWDAIGTQFVQSIQAAVLAKGNVR